MSTRRIAVDVNPLCHPGTGIYRYTFELLKRMCPLGGDWLFYASAPYDASAFQRANIRHRVAASPPGLRFSQLGQLIFPRWARDDGVEVFWSPRHHLPLLLSKEIRTVVSIHDLVWLRHGETMRFPGRQIEAFLMPRSLRRADRVVATSEFTRAELIRCFSLGADTVTVVAGASHIPIRDAALKPVGRKPYFLSVGTTEPRKNLQGLLRAYQRYRAQAERPICLKIVGGSGWGGVDARQMADQLALGGSVEVLGMVGEEALRALYAGAHALVMPSLYEGFGLPIVEALSQGVPVITSRNSAMSEVAGEAGYLVDPRSQEQLCTALTEMAPESELYATLARRTLAESQRYDWNRSAQVLFALLVGSVIMARGDGD